MKQMLAVLLAVVASWSLFAKPMAIFSRAQMKYGANRDDFIHRWYERPLHQDTSFRAADDGHFLNPAAWLKTAEAVRLSKINGFAACLTQKLRNDIINRSVMKGGEMEVLVELPYAFGTDEAVRQCYETAEMALKMPNAFRLNGRIVLTRYPACKESDLAFYSKLRDDFKTKYGDVFAFMPYFQAWEKNAYDPDAPDPMAFAAAQERLRRILRSTDGFVLSIHDGYHNRRFDLERFRRGEFAIVKSVLDEPEFKDKKHLGVLTRTGHENTYRWQYTHDSQGTTMLCGTMSAARALGADFAFCPEWDEENENTHFRPTVCNGFAVTRLLRYFSDTTAGRPLDVFPGDDVTIPNLVLSYRKSLAAGEPIEVEVRNIPDGTFKDATFSVAFAWCDADGKVVRKFSPQTLKASELANVWFTAKATDFITEHRVLRPFLGIRWEGGEYAVREGLWPLDLNPLRNLDHKWMKQPLREVMGQVEAKLEIGEPDETGMRIVRGQVKSSTPLRTIEVIDDMDTAYVYTPATANFDDCEWFRIQYKGRHSTTNLMNGSIRVEGCRVSQYNGVNNGERGDRWTPKYRDGAWRFSNMPFSVWGGSLLFAVPRAEIGRGKVVIDISGAICDEVSLQRLMTCDEYGFNTSDCRGIVVSRCPTTEFLPPAFGGKEAEFSFKWKPIEKASVLRLQLIGMDYRRWLGRPASVYRPSGKTIRTHIYERDAQTVTEVELDASMLEIPEADFSGQRGSVMYLGSGRALAGMRGASAALSQGYGQGESSYGNPIDRHLKSNTAPAEGWWALPQQLVPSFSGFRLEMEVKPKEFGKRQGLYGAGNCGLTLQIEPDGTLLALMAQGNAFHLSNGAVQARLKGPQLKAGEWNRIIFATDRKTMWFEVDGVKGEAKPYSDYFFNQRYGLLGAIHPTLDFFTGEIRTFRVDPL